MDIGQLNNYHTYLNANSGINLKACSLPASNNCAKAIEQLSIVISDDDDCVIDDDVVFVDENVNKTECVSSATSDSGGMLSSSILCSDKSENEVTKRVTFGHVEEIVLITHNECIPNTITNQSSVVSRRIQKIPDVSNSSQLLSTFEQSTHTRENVDTSVEYQSSDQLENTQKNVGCTNKSGKQYITDENTSKILESNVSESGRYI